MEKGGISFLRSTGCPAFEVSTVGGNSQTTNESIIISIPPQVHLGIDPPAPFYRPILLLRESLEIDDCQVFGNHRTFYEDQILAPLAEFLATDQLINFSFEADGKH